MLFDLSKCLEFYFKEHAPRNDKDYNYLWCSYDTDVHKHMDFYELFLYQAVHRAIITKGKNKSFIKNGCSSLNPGNTINCTRNPSSPSISPFWASRNFLNGILKKILFFRISSEKRSVSPVR